MSAENPAMVAKVPIRRKSGTVARSTFDSTLAGSVASSVSAGPQLDCSATPTTPTMIMANPIGTRARMRMKSAAMPAAPISSAFMRDLHPVPQSDDRLHEHREPQDPVDTKPEWRDRNLQDEGGLLRARHLFGIQPELPGRERERYAYRCGGQRFQSAPETALAEPDGDVRPLHQPYRQAARDGDGYGESAEVAHAFDRPASDPAQQPVGERHRREPHEGDQANDRKRPSRGERDALERCEHYLRASSACKAL